VSVINMLTPAVTLRKKKEWKRARGRGRARCALLKN